MNTGCLQEDAHPSLAGCEGLCLHSRELEAERLKEGQKQQNPDKHSARAACPRQTRGHSDLWRLCPKARATPGSLPLILTDRWVSSAWVSSAALPIPPVVATWSPVIGRFLAQPGRGVPALTSCLASPGSQP